MGAQNIANGSAALEPDFSANTINTTWYSNGEPLTGNNIPGTCTYDAPLVPPTPSPRPGYVFAGWKVRVPVDLASLGFITNGSDTCYLTVRGTSYGAQTCGLTEPGQWGAIFPYGNVIGTSLCSEQTGTKYDVASSVTPSASGTGCWCRVTGFIPDGGTLQPVSTDRFVLVSTMANAFACQNCASSCAAVYYSDAWMRVVSSGVDIETVTLNDVARLDVGTSTTGFIPSEGGAGSNAATFGLTEPGTWAADFSSYYGNVYGESMYSTTAGTVGVVGNPESGGTGSNCWCRVTKYQLNGQTNQHNLNGQWVYAGAPMTFMGVTCASSCASAVSGYNSADISYREALYGMSQ